MGAVTLKAEVLFAGKGCPVCGEKKTAEARTCRICYKILGREITRRVDAVIQAARAAKNGHMASQASERPVARGIIWGPVLAQVKIGKDAILHTPQGGIEAYLECSKSVHGGFVSAYIFGSRIENSGRMVTAIIHLINKERRPGDRINYIRAQVVLPDVIKSDVKLQFTRQEEAGALISSLPIEMVEEGKEKKRRYAVGFQRV